MYKIFIGNLEVPESSIEGFDGLVITKGMSETYWGYINGAGYGFNSNSDTATITVKDSELSAYIISVFKRDGFSAEIPFTVIDETTGDKVSTQIDFSNYSEESCCEVSFSLKPLSNGVDLINREDIEYPIALVESVSVPIRRVPKSTDWSVVDFVHNSSVGTANHSIPLFIGGDFFDEGTSRDVSTVSQLPFFTSDIDSCINILGSVEVNVVSDTPTTFSAYISFGSAKTLIGTYPITDSLTEQTITVDIEHNIIVGEDIFLTIECDSDNFAFFYNENSFGVKLETCYDEETEFRDIKAISLKSCFDEVIKRASLSRLSLGEYIFDECTTEHYLTSNEGLRDQTGVIGVSLSKLFEELNNKYPSSLSVIGDKVNVIDRCKFLTCKNSIGINPYNIKREVYNTIIYSDVKAGYNNWKPSTSGGAFEYNSTRDYVATGNVTNNSLSILGEWAASASLISEQILKKTNRDEIHVIVVDKKTMTAETNADITSTAFNADNAFNLRITPARNMERWAKYFYSDMVFTTGSGNYTLMSQDSITCGCDTKATAITENQTIVSDPILGIWKYNIMLNSCDTPPSSITGCVSFDYCGEEKTAIVIGVNYSVSPAGEQDIEVEALEILTDN